MQAITAGTPPEAGSVVSTAAPRRESSRGRSRRRQPRRRLRARWEALKGGDVGSLPVIVGIIAITAYFTTKTPIFFTSVNFVNLIGQMAGETVIAVGIVFVLLIGEIDLSVGYVSGLASVMVAEFQLAGSSHNYPGLRRDRAGDLWSAPGSARFRDRSSRSWACRRSSSRWPGS